MKRIVSILLSLLCLCTAVSASASTLTDTCALLMQTVAEPTVASVGGEWTVLALSRADSAPQEYVRGYYENVCDYVAKCGGILHERKYTEYSRVVLALTALGFNPRDVQGYDLLKPLGDFDKTVYQGVNGAAFALLALDSGQYEMPENASAKTQATRERYVDFILDAQHTDGSFSLGDAADDTADLTAMAVCALAKYQEQERVAAAVDAAVAFLSRRQDAEGGYGSAESDAQVLLALGELGVDVKDARFMKNNRTVQDDLLTYRAGQGFAHEKSGVMDLMATEQASCAFASLYRTEQEKTSFYRMEDVVKAEENSQNTTPQPEPVDAVTFVDIQGHPNQDAIASLAQRHIINGLSPNEFEPDRTMTRAEFAAIMVRALELPLQGENIFSDVPDDSWYAEAVKTAHHSGIVTGVSETEFAPLATITKEQAAVMAARAARILGQNTDIIEIRDVLAQFPDYMQSSEWARASLAYCYQSGILPQTEFEIQPQHEVTRGEIAQVIYQLLLRK